MPNRRTVLGGGAALLLGLGKHAAAGSVATAAFDDSDYKALVCVFLQGGNDGNNTVVPVGPGYGAYAAARGALSLSDTVVLPLKDADGTTQFGLHPALAPLAPAWSRQRLAWLFNTGPLVEPLTRDSYQHDGVKPDNLFSHADQQDFAQALCNVQDQQTGDGGTGWGYRLARQCGLAGSQSRLPTLISLAGNPRFLRGDVRQSLVLPARGSFGLSAGAGTANADRLDTYRRLWSQTAGSVAQPGSAIARQAGDIVGAALSAADLVNPILNRNDPALAVALQGFDGLKSDVSQQLMRVARLLQSRAQIGNRRQIFFVAMNGYDTHVNQLTDQARLLGDLAVALRAFDAAVGALGLDRQVTTFTLSDFARTLRPNGSGGTDHGWGNHQLVLGGAVRGGRTYGRFPVLAAGSVDDAGNEGRWIPSTAYDQVAATLASWFGVAPGELADVAPHIGRFGAADLGFMA